MIRRDNKIGEGSCKWRNTVGREDVARPRHASVSCNDLEKAAGSFYSVSRSDDTEMGRSCRVAGDANVKHGGAIHQIGAEAYVGGEVVEAECATAIDGDGNFGREPLRQGRVRQRPAQIRGDGAGVENFLGIQSGERIGMDRNSIVGCDSERGY